jgi:ABC-2 type transport system ATP-binding protein
VYNFWLGEIDMSDLQLQVEGLRKTFDPGLFESEVEVLKGLSFSVARGEIFGFLGPNGAGKTTTIKAITDIITPDAGTITVCGLPHTSFEAKRRVGFMTESPYIYRHLTGREFLRFCGDLLSIERAELERRIRHVLDEVRMSAAGDRAMGNYSKGMLQRVTLAQALLGEPELLILDEPMSGLDPVGRRDVRDIILAQAAGGVTVFFSSHIIPDVEALCDRVAIVVDGRVQALGTVRELVSTDAELYEATFSGVDPTRLQTPLVDRHLGGGKAWARVRSEDRDELIEELAKLEAHLESLNPVTATLEDLLMRHYEGAAS